ncbi:AAA family ATPase [Clostridium sp. AM58-1XD]|uniref:ATP-binding protein n=1 Tax=Clostridium sp. AM58-1XD TaxID=2292307 RepID=UPI0015F565C5|nr:AAA family ATPase [Clostridium sp. AM58-1XD]
MEYLGQYADYFHEEQAVQPYCCEREALEEIMSMVDLCLEHAFYWKDANNERLDMRGIVITPQECGAALTERRLSALKEREFRMKEIRDGQKQELSYALNHIRKRAGCSIESDRDIRVWRLIRDRELNTLEQIVFFVALCSDLDRKYERLYGYLQDNVAAKLPTEGLGLALFSLFEDYGGELWLSEKSRVWELLDQTEERERKESRLSAVLAVRENVFSYIKGEREAEDGEGELGRLTTRIKCSYVWDDLILEEEQKDQMRHMCAQIKNRKKVREEWGFGKKSPYGNGISAVFFGPPGTGKTMAAQVIARELGLPLYRIDISRIVSKYIGETEKNISSLFHEAEGKNAVLFFDEADGLFAKRSSVTTSNDRYANMETGYLLQRFEDYEGVSILATNYINNMDDAFKRRIRFMVRFPFPNPAMRKIMWKSMFPKEAPIEEGLPTDFLGEKFEIPGSGIREIIMNAAYLAVEEGNAIGGRHLKGAIRGYYQKLGRNLTDEELRG